MCSIAAHGWRWMKWLSTAFNFDRDRSKLALNIWTVLNLIGWKSHTGSSLNIWKEQIFWFYWKEQNWRVTRILMLKGWIWKWRKWGAFVVGSMLDGSRMVWARSEGFGGRGETKGQNEVNDSQKIFTFWIISLNFEKGRHARYFVPETFLQLRNWPDNFLQSLADLKKSRFWEDFVNIRIEDHLFS